MVITVNSLRGQLMSLVNFFGAHKEQADRYRQLLEIVLTNSGSELKLFVEAIVNEHVSLVISRQILNDVSLQLAILPDEVSKQVSLFALEKVQPRVASIRQRLAEIYRLIYISFKRLLTLILNSFILNLLNYKLL
uniref:Uncharacterized protein n=1 Tax=Glossina brevipalpis TaxID=37001 RepID=A0A1A9W9X1_9MUSC